MEKKDEDEEGPPKREKPKQQKPRPKSMFVKAVAPGLDLDGVDGCSSTEDLSTRALTIPVEPSHNTTACKLSDTPPTYTGNLN